MKAHRRRRGVNQLTMALDGGEWLTPRPDCFTSRKKVLVPTEQETGWVPEHARVNKQEYR